MVRLLFAVAFVVATITHVTAYDTWMLERHSLVARADDGNGQKDKDISQLASRLRRLVHRRGRPSQKTSCFVVCLRSGALIEVHPEKESFRFLVLPGDSELGPLAIVQISDLRSVAYPIDQILVFDSKAGNEMLQSSFEHRIVAIPAQANGLSELEISENGIILEDIPKK